MAWKLPIGDAELLPPGGVVDGQAQRSLHHPDHVGRHRGEGEGVPAAPGVGADRPAQLPDVHRPAGVATTATGG